MTTIDRLEFDVRKLKSFSSPNQFSKYFDKVDQERFTAAWLKIAENPVDAAVAAVAAGYCDTWYYFCVLASSYGVDKESSPELNQQFRAKLKEKGLDKVVAELYANQEAV